MKPAIILITCDELKRDTLGFYGNRAIATPHIDGLARRSRVYDRCYTTSPWCLPARCSILTGLYPHRSGAYSNFRKCPLDGNIKNLFKELRAGGYTTSLFGKCHFAPVPYRETRPGTSLPYGEFRDYYMSLGLDHLALEDDKQVSVWFQDDYSKELEQAGFLTAYRDKVWDKSLQKVFPFPGPAAWHPDAWVGDRAASFIKNNAEGKPLFAWISFSGPHYPFDAPAEYLSRVDRNALVPRKTSEGELADPSRIHHRSFYGAGGIDGCNQAPDSACMYFTEDYWEALRENYNANVALIDDKVGEILSAVEERYGDNALVFFTADHGEMLGNHGLWGKHNCGYDEVWRIPMFVKLPHEGELQRIDTLTNLTDILPTCLAAAGLPPIEADGQSLCSPDGKTDRIYTFAEGEGYIACTDSRYKYIHIQKRGENYRELLDTCTDPDEFFNRIGDPSCLEAEGRLKEQVIGHFMPRLLP
ncbi:MAG: sulfatase-like hydrolase/transferase [Spirochaetaceae bacterium]|jgi:arylsulfatase A-like enzyme|nr:sulfatase-like hydrolase/transferase [Spirochaetaceae bacterium]